MKAKTIKVELYFGRMDKTWDTFMVEFKVPIGGNSLTWSNEEIKQEAIELGYLQLGLDKPPAFLGIYHWDYPELEDEDE